MENCLQFISFPGKSDTLEQEILVLAPQSGAKTQLWSQFWEYEFFCRAQIGTNPSSFFGVLDYNLHKRGYNWNRIVEQLQCKLNKYGLNAIFWDIQWV
jgi:hypothetical protein